MMYCYLVHVVFPRIATKSVINGALKFFGKTMFVCNYLSDWVTISHSLPVGNNAYPSMESVGKFCHFFEEDSFLHLIMMHEIRSDHFVFV